MIKTLETCSLEFFENYVVSTIYEGVIFGKKESQVQTKEILEVFKNKPFVYISNRINSYSVDPIIYLKTSKIASLAGFAIVSKSLSARNAEVESLFLNKPFEIFDTLEEAKSWANSLLKS